MSIDKQTGETIGDERETGIIIIDINDGAAKPSSNGCMEKFKLLDEALVEAEDQRQSRKPLIQRVPLILQRDKNCEKYFEPRVISFGPLHHRNDKFKLGEKIKIKLAALFIKEHGLHNEHVYNAILTEIGNFKKCYCEEDLKNYEDDELAWILFVDGCAVLYFIKCAADAKSAKLEELKIKEDLKAFVQLDLFLLENQLPYPVLEALMKCLPVNDQSKMKNSIDDFTYNIARHTRGHRLVKKGEMSSSEIKPTHLLELFRKQLLSDQSQQKGQIDTGSGTKLTASEDVWSFRNVNELRAAGIKLKSKTDGSLEDISFASKWFTGTLTLPSIIVDDSTAPKFLNLIAYEMCPDFPNNFEVSSYISFLDSLIDEPDDVKRLRKRRVLFNFLGSNEEVTKIFNEIGTDLVPNLSAYSNVRKNIQEHDDKKWKTWLAQAIHDRFSSPWTFIAFVAATAALAMSFVQTWYAIHPAN